MEKKGSFQNLPECTCANGKTSKYRYYHYEGQLLGVCCTKCGQEWLQERFLFHPDKVDSRPSVTVNNVVLKKQLKMEVESNPAFQVSGSRTMSKNFKFEGNRPKVGAHITWHRHLGYWHHGIVSEVKNKGEKVKVIQWEKISNACFTVERTESWIDLNKEKGQLFRIDYSDEVTKINTSDLVIARGKSLLDDPGKYSVFGDNCEALASYCKTGFAQSCQLVWLNRVLKIGASVVLTTIGRCFGDAALFVQNLPSGPLTTILFSEGMANVSIEACQIASKGFLCAGVGIVLLIEGTCCVFDLSKIYDKRVNAKISRVDFVQSSIRRAFAALASAGLCIGGSMAGAEVGMLIGTLICPGIGTAAGFLIGGIVGGVVGGLLGKFVVAPVVGPWIARKFASIIGRDDRAVEIGDLQPGDHVVFYGNRLHPRHHAIVLHCDPAEGTGKVTVVHHTYKNGVVEEVLDFIPPVFRLLYDKPPVDRNLHDKPSVDRILHDKPSVDRILHDKPSVDRILHDKPSVDRILHDKPPVDRNLHDKPPMDRNLHDKPSVDRILYDKPSVDRILHEKPSEDRILHDKPSVDRNLHDKPSVDRILHDKECVDDCYRPEEVIERAKSKIGDETYKYSLAFKNCKDFARWCKEK